MLVSITAPMYILIFVEDHNNNKEIDFFHYARQKKTTVGHRPHPNKRSWAGCMLTMLMNVFLNRYNTVLPTSCFRPSPISKPFI